MADRSKLSSPFTNAFGVAAPKLPTVPHLTRANPCPYFDHPHDRGPDTIPVVFEERLFGRSYHGGPEVVERQAAICSPMQTSRR